MKRIDEILLEQRKVSEADIEAALSRQKAIGGKLCSHLLDSGAASEADLLSALSEHFGVPAVSISSVVIPSRALALIPLNLALSRVILPFEYDLDQNLVKIACVDPNDTELRSELSYLLGNRFVEYFVAVELALTRAINHHYTQHQRTDPQPDAGKTQTQVAQAKQLAGTTRASSLTTSEIDSKRALIFSGQPGTRKLLHVVLEQDGFVVADVDSVNRIEESLRQTPFGTIFIQTDNPEEHIDLLNGIRSISPPTRIRVFRSMSDLLTNDSQPVRADNRLEKQLELFTSLLTIQERVPRSQSMRVAYFVDKLCRHLGLKDDQRVMVMSAAHLHEQAKFYYMTTATPNFRRLMRLVTKLLQSVYYEPAVIEILRSMYLDISDDALSELPIEATGGNILTVVDMFSETIQPTQRLTLDRIQEFQSKVHQEVGKRLYPEVFETFLKVVKEESTRTPTVTRSGQIMIYSEPPEKVLALTDRLKSEGFRTIIAPSRSSLSRLCKRCRPDLIVLRVDGPSRTVFSVVKELQNLHIDPKETPIIVLAPQVLSGDLTPLLEWGIADILDCECDPDHVTFKVNKSWTGMKMSADARETDDHLIASRGSLQDMNLIELLQVLGTSGRTTRIRVVSSAPPHQSLEICLKRGQIVFAQLDDLQGVEAIYVGITWDSGTWSMEPITDVPEQASNSQLSNEAILLEGCRLLDEMRAAH
ncbi:MAG: DUF4388 domain-containing protein [Candidatus Zixiibacteriota bacterium]|nr:MAG: DUF4388 domain-containing protein [candidate division Zixibacteria bacterium]